MGAHFTTFTIMTPHGPETETCPMGTSEQGGHGKEDPSTNLGIYDAAEVWVLNYNSRYNYILSTYSLPSLDGWLGVPSLEAKPRRSDPR